MKAKNIKQKFYHVTMEGGSAKTIFSDERIKKHFLMEVESNKEIIPFAFYSYCFTNEDVHFLIDPASDTKAKKASKLLQIYLKKSCKRFKVDGIDSLQVNVSSVEIEDEMMLLEYSSKIHLLGLKCAEHLKDHWWSSYNEYVNKHKSGIVNKRVILSYLHPNPKTAINKFIQFHKNKLAYNN